MPSLRGNMSRALPISFGVIGASGARNDTPNELRLVKYTSRIRTDSMKPYIPKVALIKTDEKRNMLTVPLSV